MRKLFYILLILPTLATAQHGALTSAGDNVTTSSRIINWSIGNTISGISSSDSHIIYEGIVVEVYRILYKEENFIKMNCYPNPVTEGYFYLELQTNDVSDLEWQLFSTTGKIIKKGKVTKDLLKIDISGLKSPSYILNVTDKNKTKIATAKLLKK